MIDAPERIWSIGSEGPYRISCSILDHSDEPGCTEYVRADLVADKADAWDAISAKNAEIARLQEQVETLTRKKERFAELYAREAAAHMAYREAAEAERDRLREALRQIKLLKSEQIGDTPFAVGPLSLFRAAQRIAHAALQKEPQTAQERDDGR